MVIMDNKYELLDLREKIDKYHLGYLHMEESPEKMDYRIKLEEFVRDYLCIAPHTQKFTLQATADILERSASSKLHFSGYKAARGWNAIQLYAGNLLSQPWRNEYRRIKMYCGFYKHQIEANLVGAEVMFETMGYKHAGDGILILEGPICPDRVQSVSKDSLIAYVECQILKVIWEEVSTFCTNITWNDLVEFRKTYICSPEQAVKNFRYYQRQEQQRSYTLKSPQTSPILPVNHSFPPLTSHHYVTMPMQPSQYVCNGLPCCSNNFTPCTTPSYSYLSYNPPVIKSHYNTNGFFYTNGYPQLSNYNNCPVPTGQLIEFETQNGTNYDVVDGRKHRQVSDLYKIKNNNDVKNLISDENEPSYEDWDYVYRNLENQGYNKDLGERGDILSPTSKQNLLKETKKVKTTNLDEAINGLSVNERPLKLNNTLERDKKRERRHSQSSSYENVTPNEMRMAKSVQKLNSSHSTNTKVKTLPREKVNVNNDASKSKTLDGKLKKQMEKNCSTNWQCTHCTYLNQNENKVCEICGKSQIKVDEQPIEVGGAECSKCTLVNPKNAVKCQACDSSLKDSPTYI